MKLLERIISIYAPLECVGCGAEGSVACRTCLAALARVGSCCYRCNVPSSHGKTCVPCRKTSSNGGPGGLVSANAATMYDGMAKDLVWRLKFGRVQAAAEHMASHMAALYGPMVADDVLIVPVPTATKRVRGRGYDQAVLIARSFAMQTGCAYAPLLLRVGSQEQIGASKLQRHEQLQGVFQVRSPRSQLRAQGARILLIDDVMTSGATLETAAATLRKAGAKTVGSLVFARA